MTKSDVSKAVRRGFLVCLAQIGLLLLLAPSSSSFSERYLRLLNWDSQHYLSIATHGYVLPEAEISSDDIHSGKANVVFFPGYPALSRGVAGTLGIPISWALLLVAQLCCWLFWIYFQLILRTADVSERSVDLALLCACVHPAAFFVVCGYTEAMFLAGMLGYLYWSDAWLVNRSGRTSTRAYLLAAIHGFAMSATRIVAAAVLPYPYLKGWRAKAYLPALLLAIVGGLGGILFFAYCQYRFGDWSVYFRLEEIGWRNHRMWFAVIDPRSYIPRFFFEHTVESFNRAALPFTLLLFGWAYRREKRQPDRGSRFPIYLTAFLLFYIPLTGKANANMDSMIRYTFPVFILLTLCLAPMIERQGLSKRVKWAMILGGVSSFAIELWFAHRFLHGKWVA